MKKGTYMVSAAALMLLLPSQTVQAVDSHIKMRVYKDFVKEVLSSNIESFFQRAASQDIDDIPIPELKSKLTGA
jgi:hypothetical protein